MVGRLRCENKIRDKSATAIAKTKRETNSSNPSAPLCMRECANRINNRCSCHLRNMSVLSITIMEYVEWMELELEPFV